MIAFCPDWKILLSGCAAGVLHKSGSAQPGATYYYHIWSDSLCKIFIPEESLKKRRNLQTRAGHALTQLNAEFAFRSRLLILPH